MFAAQIETQLLYISTRCLDRIREITTQEDPTRSTLSKAVLKRAPIGLIAQITHPAMYRTLWSSLFLIPSLIQWADSVLTVPSISREYPLLERIHSTNHLGVPVRYLELWVLEATGETQEGGLIRLWIHFEHRVQRGVCTIP